MLWSRSFLALIVIGSVAQAADWPQWRGPNRDGVSTETGLLKKWPEKGPTLLWEARGAGRGYSSVAIAAGKLYTMGDGPSTGEGKDEYLLCLDANTGKKVWQTKIGPPYTKGQSDWQSSRSTPTVDGDLLFVLTGNGDLICLETAGGKEQWRKNMQKDFGGKKVENWGYSESVLIDGDRLFCSPGGKASMVALNKKTGETIWTAPLPGNPGAGHASIMMTEVGKTRVCVQTCSGFGFGVRASDGKVLWTVKDFRATAVIPTPIVRGDLVLLAAGYRLGGTLLRQVPDADGGVTTNEIYPINKGLANKHGGIILVGDYLYGDTEDSSNPFCVEFLTGKLMWKKRGAGGSVSMVAAEGNLYMHYANGTMVLAKALPDDYTVISSFKLPHSGGRPSWSHPVIANGKLYVREGDFILCYNVQAN